MAQTARIKGVVLDKNNQPVENVNVSYSSAGTRSNQNGFYDLKVPANQKRHLAVPFLWKKQANVT